jgi:class 3 adenylate cyclase
VTVRYVRSGDVHIAYRTVGEGPVDIIYFPPMFVSFDAYDENPHTARFSRRLASFARLIEFDDRDIGLSDAGQDPLSVDLATSDALRVLDAVGSERAVLLSVAGGGAVGITIAATAPERACALVLVNAYARLIRADDYPIGYPESVITSFMADNVDPETQWDDGSGATDVSLMMPSLQRDARFLDWLERSAHRAASPEQARRHLRLITTFDVRHLLSRVTVPTLVLTRRENKFVPSSHSRYLAEHIPNAKLVELPGADHMPFSGDADGLADEIEDFVTGRRSGGPDRILATLVFSDIVDSTRRASEIGDVAWRAELDTHDAVVRAQLGRYGGREVNTTGDGFVAVFDSPTNAVECARAVATSTGLPVRVGVHTGECERRGDDVAGLAVHVAARVAACAAAGEVLVSRTVCDLVSGSSLRFVSRGEHTLKGIDRPWELFQLAP